MITICVRCLTVLQIGSSQPHPACFDSNLAERKRKWQEWWQIPLAYKDSERVTWAWCGNCYALEKNA